MNDSLPIALAILILLVSAIYSAKAGILPLLAAGLSTVAAVAAFLLVFRFLPGPLDTFLDVTPGWRTLTIAGVTTALAAFILVRFPLVWALRRVFGPDSKLHVFADGFPAVVLSVLPSAIVILFLFTCFRVAGTIQELHYVAALGREGIEHNGGRIPPYPRPGVWREQIESLPRIVPLLDAIDPFSRAEPRNAAAIVLLDQAGATRTYFALQPETAPLFADESMRGLDEIPSIRSALDTRNRAALVLDAQLREKAADSQLSPVLKELHLRPVLERFVDSLVPRPESGTTNSFP